MIVRSWRWRVLLLLLLPWEVLRLLRDDWSTAIAFLMNYDYD